MSPEKTKQLQEAFPEYFKDLYGDPMRTCLAFGIETEDGWYDLIYKLCEDIKKVNPEEFEISQIKEKFSTLRFYYMGGNKEVDELVSAAEDKSGTICETCGADGSLHSRGTWLKTVCSDCAGSDYIKCPADDEEED